MLIAFEFLSTKMLTIEKYKTLCSYKKALKPLNYSKNWFTLFFGRKGLQIFRLNGGYFRIFNTNSLSRWAKTYFWPMARQNTQAFIYFSSHLCNQATLFIMIIFSKVSYMIRYYMWPRLILQCRVSLKELYTSILVS